MATATVDDRPLTLTLPSAFKPDELRLTSFNGSEVISQPFHFFIDLVAKNDSTISFTKLLGERITINLKIRGDKTRHFNGICTSVSQGERGAALTGFRIELRPQLWTLSKTTQSRIFQGMTVPEILAHVLKGLSPDFSRVKETYHKREYCVQYRETDLNFASRLMEEEGIFYYFEHEARNHKLVLCDTSTSLPELPHLAQPGKIPYGVAGDSDTDVIYLWEKVQELQSGQVLLRDHHFQLPFDHLQSRPANIQDSATVGVVIHKLKAGGSDKWQIYDYPGYYAQRFDGVGPSRDDKPDDLKLIEEEANRTATLRMQEEATCSVLLRGAGYVPQMSAGFRFALKEHFNADGDYVITGVTHSASLPMQFRAGSGHSGAFTYQNSFTCIPKSIPFRPARVTPKPFVQGVQTAIVVGSGTAEEEIYTDKYGRVKVQFHWDRRGEHNKSDTQGTYKLSSCWVRFAQPWAGKRWGAYFVPRIGQELIIDFLEGDPDQPIAIGTVYNADQMPPYLGEGLDSKHAHNPRLSGIKSNTTPGGEGYNELRFDDSKDKEQIFLHAQRNLDMRVRRDTMESVLADRHLTVGGEKDGKKHGDQHELVYQDKHLNVKRHQIEWIEGSMQLTIGGGEESGGLDLVVAGDRKAKIGGDCHLVVDGDRRESINGKQSLAVNGDQHEKVGGSHALEAGGAIHIKAGATLVIEAAAQLSLKVGGNFIDINPGGVFIQGTMVMINSGGAAGTGMGPMPETPLDAQVAEPKKPLVADDSKSGVKSTPDSWPS